MWDSSTKNFRQRQLRYWKERRKVLDYVRKDCNNLLNFHLYFLATVCQRKDKNIKVWIAALENAAALENDVFRFCLVWENTYQKKITSWVANICQSCIIIVYNNCRFHNNWWYLPQYNCYFIVWKMVIYAKDFIPKIKTYIAENMLDVSFLDAPMQYWSCKHIFFFKIRLISTDIMNIYYSVLNSPFPQTRLIKINVMSWWSGSTFARMHTLYL